MKTFLLFVLTAASTAFSQQIDPRTQIEWPLITGAGTPSSLSISCASTNYGQPYQNISVTPNTFYTCGTDGWVIRGYGGSYLPLAGGTLTGNIGEVSQSLTATDANNISVPTTTIYTHIFDQSTFALPPVTTGLGSQSQDYRTLKAYGPGLNLGSFDGAGGRVVSQFELAGTFAERGISQMFGAFGTKHATGDFNTYNYLYSDGGSNGAADEGIGLGNFSGGETNGYFHGTIASTTGTGDTAPVLSFTSGNNWTTDGGPLLDISKGTVNGNYGGVSTPFGSTYLFQIPVSNTLPLSTAWGTLTSVIPNPAVTPNNSVTNTYTVTLGAIGGSSPSFTAGKVCIAGPNYPEQAILTNPSSASGGTQTITLTYHNPNGSGSQYPVLFQGGVCGQYISEDANLAYSNYRTSYYAFGAITTGNLIYGVNSHGSVTSQALPFASGAQTTTGGYHLYPGAEIVENTSTGATPVLEPNSVAWAASDVIENPHYTVINTNALKLDITQNTPANNANSAVGTFYARGFGVAGVNYFGFRLINAQPCSQYSDCSGASNYPQSPFAAYNVSGYWASPFHSDYGPSSLGSMMDIGGTFKGDTSPFLLAQLRNGTGAGPIIGYNPALGATYVPKFQITGIGGSTQCLQASSTGVVSGTGAACGSGGSGTVNSYSGTVPAFALYSATGSAVGGASNTQAAAALNGGTAPTAGQVLIGQTGGGVTFQTISGDITCVATGACTNVGINGQNLAALPTGVVVNTNGTGVPTTKSLAGSGAAVPTGPSTTAIGDIVTYAGTNGQQQDSNVAASNVQAFAPISGAIMELPLTEGTGTTAYDITGNNNNGTFVVSHLPTWYTYGVSFLDTGTVTSPVQLISTPLTTFGTLYIAHCTPTLVQTTGTGTGGVPAATYPTLVGGSVAGTGVLLLKNALVPDTFNSTQPTFYNQTGAAVVSSAAGAYGGCHIYGFSAGSSTDHITVDGVETNYLAQGASATLTTLSSGTYNIGGSGTGTVANALRGTVSYVVAFSSAHTVAQMQQETAYIKGKLLMRPTFPAQPSPSIATASQAIFVGDSLTATYEGSSVWSSGLTLTNSYTVSNLGIGGMSVLDMCSDFEHRVVPFIVSNSSVIMLWGGTNDAKFGTAAATTYSYMASCIAKAHKYGARIVLATKIDGNGADSLKDALNPLIRANWKRDGADGMVDYASDAAIGGDGTSSNTACFQSDATHLTGPGTGTCGAFNGTNYSGYGLVAQMAQSEINTLDGSSAANPTVTASNAFVETAANVYTIQTPTASATHSLWDCLGQTVTRTIVNSSATYTITVSGVNSETIAGSASIAPLGHANFTPTLTSTTGGGCYWLSN